jgi:putative ABC transport system permease protein
LRNAGNQYLIKSKWKVKNMGLDITTIGPLAKAMKEDYPDLVANYYRYNPVTNVVSAGENYFKEDISIGDTTFISMYGFPVLHGNKKQAFRDNNSAVITESMAIKLFGKTDAIGQRISLQTLVNNEKQDYLVSAVLKDIPFNSVTGLIGSNYTVFVPTVDSRYYQVGDPSVNWNSAYEVGLIELKEGVTAADMEKPFIKMLEKNAPENIRDNLKVELVPVKDYYLKDNNGAAQKMIITLALIGGFILLMAVINFVNISIGTSSYRLKEIGLRKVLGGQKKQIVVQFLSESLLLSIIAGIISLLCYSLLRPVFNQLLNTSIDTITEFNAFGLSCFGAFILLVGIISGLYPALVLSSSRLIFSVKGKMTTAGSGSLLRKSLLVTQFTLTIIVFIGALSVSRQVSYIFNKDLGYNKEQLLVVTAFPKQWDSAGVLRMEGIKQQLLQLPVVESATVAFEIPDRKPPALLTLLPVDEKKTQPVNIPTINVDEDYAATYEMKMANGNFFNYGKGAFVPGRIVLNETAAKSLGLDVSSAVGRAIKFPSGVAGEPLIVAGIVKDYNYSNIQEGIEPLAFMHVKDFLSYRYLTVRLKPGNISQAIADVKQKWKEASPNSPFEYFFMDEKFQALYNSELQLKKAANTATMLNLFIVLMGVFGVVAFTLTRRNKEIAIRKVLGANAPGIIKLFLKEYGLTILIANIIAWPLAYIIVNSWLQNYSYRVEQDIFSYLLVGVLVLCLAFVMIVAQCFKVAAANPVQSLRSE